MCALTRHVRSDGSCPYEDYVSHIFDSGRHSDAAKIESLANLLDRYGSQRLAKMGKAKKMNGVWELRVNRHRVFYFWHAKTRQYVLLNGFLKKSRKTPTGELQRAEALRAEHLM